LNGAVTCGGGALTSNAAGTVIYGSAGAQTVCASTNYGILQISGGGTKTLGGAVTTAGALTVGASTTLSQGASALTVGGTMTVNGTFTGGGATLTLGPSLVNNGSFTFDGGGSGCGGTPAAINGTTIWSGSGGFAVIDATLSAGQSSSGVAAYNSTGGAGFASRTCAQFPTAVRLASFTATAYGDRVLVEWRTGFEVDNVGFRVFREGLGESSKVTPHLVAGSGLLAGRGTNLHAGRTYSWWDQIPAGSDPRAIRY
jgi:hypothetical protein